MYRAKLKAANLLNNSFLISSIILIVYSAINPELLSLSEERVSYFQVFNAINWPLNQTWPFLTGLTAWTPIEDSRNGIYFVELISYLPLVFARLILNVDMILKLQRLIDIAVIIGGISLLPSWLRGNS